MNVIITGASKGIGFELCKEFLQKGHRVIAIARSNVQMQRLKEYNVNETLIILSGDLTVGEDFSRVVTEIHSEIEKVDILINNAGFLVNKPFTEISEKDIEKTFSINYRVPLFLTQKLLNHFEAASAPHIVNIGSMGGFQGSSKFNGLSIYSSSKAALANLTECLAEELSEKNIKVNCLALGATQTEMLSKAFPGYEAPVSASSMAQFIYGFAVDSSKFINGKVIPVALNNP